MSDFTKNELQRAADLKANQVYKKEGWKKAKLLGYNLSDYENHLFAFLIDVNLCLLPVYLWALEFLLILTGLIPPNFFDLLFYLMYGLLFLTSCIGLPLYTASTGGYSWGGKIMQIRLVRNNRKPAAPIKLVLRQLLGFGVPMMVFGYFFSVFGLVIWWLIDGLIVLVSPGQRTLFDWVFGLVDVYAPAVNVKFGSAKPKAEPIVEEPRPAPQPEPVADTEPVSKIDLHIRSNFSDDSDAEVEDIFQQAKDKGIEIISITDHNNARANALAAHFAKLYQVQYIPGVEIDCQLYGERVRILGYYINWNDPFFDTIERLSLKREKDVSLARVEAFEKCTGLKVDTDDLLTNSRFQILTPKELTRLVFDTPEARELPAVKNYLAGALNEAEAREHFERDYFGEGGKCEVRAEYPNAIKVIKAIHEAGGMAVLSGWHLDRISNDVIEGLLDGGIDGFEVFTPLNSEKTKAFLLSLVQDEKLFITEGSDYHGTRRPDRKLGVTTATEKGEKLVRIFTRALEAGSQEQ